MTIGLMCDKVDAFNSTPAFKGNVVQNDYDTSADCDSLFQFDTTADLDTAADFDTVADMDSVVDFDTVA